MPATFLTELQTDITAYEDFVGVKLLNTQTRSQALQDLDKNSPQSSQLVDALDALLHNAYRDDKQKLDGWRAVKRISLDKAHRRKPKPPTPPTP